MCLSSSPHSCIARARAKCKKQLHQNPRGRGRVQWVGGRGYGKTVGVTTRGTLGDRETGRSQLSENYITIRHIYNLGHLEAACRPPAQNALLLNTGTRSPLGRRCTQRCMINEVSQTIQETFLAAAASGVPCCGQWCTAKVPAAL
jgi:hypothetical protein